MSRKQLRIEMLEQRDNPSYMLPAIDFSPYILAGENPNNGVGQISPAVLTARLTAMAPYAEGIRTFDCTGDLQPSAQIIRSLGKTCLIGAWLQDDNAANQTAIDAANQAAVNELIAEAHAGNVDVAIIGSETQQRGKFAESKLLTFINQVKNDFALNNLHIPVTTADTYPALLQHPAILTAVDVVYANFYPFWEQQPVEGAVAVLNHEYHTLQELVPSKTVFVSETGWPSSGSAQGAAVPSPENAAAYALNAVSWARSQNIPYAYFEAIDEPFKIIQEGDVGPHWGMFNSDLTRKTGMQPIFDGDVVLDNWSAVDFLTMPSQMTTNIANFVLSGSTAPGNTIEVNGVPIPSSEIDSGGAYAHMIPLANGNNNLVVEIRDSGGTLLSTITKDVDFETTYSTGNRGLLYVDAVSTALNGTLVIDPANRLILGIIAGQHIRGVSADGREIYMDDRSVLSRSTHQFLRPLPFSLPIISNGFLVSPTGDVIYSHNEVLDVATNTLLAPLPMDITTGDSYASAPIPGGPAIMPDGSAIFAGDPIMRIDVGPRTMTATGVIPTGFVSDLAVSPDGQWLVASSYSGGGRVAIFGTATYQPMGTVPFGDFAGKIQFLDASRAIVGNAGNPANGGGSITVFDAATQQLIQSVPMMLADNVAATGTGNEVFAATGDSLGIVARAVAADGTLRQSTTYHLGINRYVQGTGIPANDELRGLYFDPAPVIAIDRTTPIGPQTTATSVVYTVTFGKNVAGVDGTDFDLSLSGVTATIPVAVSGSGSVYMVTISGIAGSGTLGLNLVDDDSIKDAGNVPLGGTGIGNADFTGQVYNIDTNGPTVTIDRGAGQADPTNTGPILFAVHFSEPVTGLTNGDVKFTGSTVGGTPVGIVTGSGADYVVSVTGMTGEGNVVASIPAGVATDGIGNGNVASTSTDNSVAFDTVSPTVTIDQDASQNDPTSVASILFKVVFSESVTDFTNTDVDLTASTVGGTPVASVSGSGTDYTVTVTGIAGAGDVIAAIPAGKVHDAASNACAPSISTDNSVFFAHSAALQFSQAVFNTNEGAVKVTITVNRLNLDEGPVSVDYATSGGTATSGTDFTPIVTGTLNWPAADTNPQTFDVLIADDGINEGRESFTVTLSNPTGNAFLGPQSTATVTIAKSNGVDIDATGKKPQSTFTDIDDDRVTLKLAGKVGTLTYFLTNGKGPIAEIDLAGTDSAKSNVNLTVAKPKGGTGDGRVGIGEIGGTGARSLSLAKADLTGGGINLSKFLSALRIGDVKNGADITLAGAPPKTGQATKITAGVIGDTSDIAITGAPLASLTATRIGVGTIAAPSIGTITTKGKAKTKAAVAIPGDFQSNLTIAGTDLLPKVPALKLLKVAGSVSASTILINGDVGSVLAGSFVNSRLFAGYTGPDDGLGTFDLPSTIGSFVVTGKTDAFAHSNVIASNFKNVSLASVDPANGGIKFGFLYHSTLTKLSIKNPSYKFDPKGPAEQDPVGVFYIKKV